MTLVKRAVRKVLVGVIAFFVGGPLLVFAVSEEFREILVRRDLMRSFVSNGPVECNGAFQDAVAEADRIVVWDGRFDCCGGALEEGPVLFCVTTALDVADVATHLKFDPPNLVDSMATACMCCGGPRIDWYRGGERIAVTALQHGHALRWKGFSTVRLCGLTCGFYGDAVLGPASQAWLKEWLTSHGVEISGIANQRRGF